jgi:anaerobic magnesium-protoporphyrin IX monomethyl ester cyclase
MSVILGITAEPAAATRDKKPEPWAMIRRHEQKVDVLFVNPPSPDGFVYIRDINRHGRSSWERMIWPQTSLAYLAAVADQLGMTADIVDCIAEEISWPDFEDILRNCSPRFCFSNIISVTYSNDVQALAGVPYRS